MRDIDQLKPLLAQLDYILGEYEQAIGKHDRLSEAEGHTWTYRIRMLAIAAVSRIAGRSSPYWRSLEPIAQSSGGSEWRDMHQSVGIVKALRDDLENGYVRSVTELIHAELFGDFLDMAYHLLQEGGYKDAAAVIAGSSLEAHLKALCRQASIPILNESGRPIKADQLNALLRKSEVYGTGDQKQITSWLDLRNDAAHGDYDKYESERVRLMIEGVRDFIARNPA